MSDDARTRSEWIGLFAARLGVDPPEEQQISELLALAGTAAHASERTAAPIACWLVGRCGLSASAALELARQI